MSSAPVCRRKRLTGERAASKPPNPTYHSTEQTILLTVLSATPACQPGNNANGKAPNCQIPAIQVNPCQVRFMNCISFIKKKGILVSWNILPREKKEKKRKSQLHRTGYTVQHCTAQHRHRHHKTTLSAIIRRRLRLHLNPILSRFVSRRPMAVVAAKTADGVVVEAVVVVDSLAHAVHNDGAVDYLGDGADTGHTRLVSMGRTEQRGSQSKPDGGQELTQQPATAQYPAPNHPHSPRSQR